MKEHVLTAVQEAFDADDLLLVLALELQEAPICTDSDLGGWLELAPAAIIETLGDSSEDQLNEHKVIGSYMIARLATRFLELKEDRAAAARRLVEHGTACAHCRAYGRMRDRQLNILTRRPGSIGACAAY